MQNYPGHEPTVKKRPHRNRAGKLERPKEILPIRDCVQQLDFLAIEPAGMCSWLRFANASLLGVKSDRVPKIGRDMSSIGKKAAAVMTTAKDEFAAASQLGFRAGGVLGRFERFDQ